MLFRKLILCSISAILASCVTRPVPQKVFLTGDADHVALVRGQSKQMVDVLVADKHYLVPSDSGMALCRDLDEAGKIEFKIAESELLALSTVYVVRNCELVIPFDLRIRGSYSAIVSFTINSDGSVSEIGIVEQDTPSIGRAANATVGGLLFEPPKLAGGPVRIADRRRKIVVEID
jgi:hypothetical protein